ncbi:hypothetical protein RHSIM_Rhsim03G0162000 [Rhododendron simsii]|uniref:F-box domain-containing protein n=1 Tax=Rhododendron simsii TaxID=118357 RepID=A0A834HB92_RHOSS|nr:hypothetical protein RHSIM_Rhsim03G0162000 [Rhododendron simsii]
MSEYPSSADTVASNDDLLTEILIRVPVKSLLRFKSVSKHWLSLIATPHFARCRNPDPCSVSGLFLYSSGRRLNSGLNFIPLQNDGNPTDGNFTTFPSGMKILSSCHGLLCCTSFSRGNHQFHILNPTTKQFTSLPQPRGEVKGLSLCFDPCRSPYYKVVCVLGTVSVLSREPYQSEWRYQIEIYSSETGTWRPSGEPFIGDLNTQFLGGVYWHGAIHWFNTWGDSLYFDIEDERLGILPMPTIPQGEGNWRPFRYYGESRGHLHLVEIYGARAQFCVYEMEADYSGWFVKYNVDLHEVGIAFPEMMQRLSWDPMYYSFAILAIVREEEDDERSFLVLHVPGKIVRYNLVNKSFEKIGDVDPEHCDSSGMIEDALRYFWFHAFQYIETVSRI